MEKVEFKEGDWCFCEFKHQLIKKMNGKCITSVSDGTFEHGSSDMRDRCYPVNLRTKQISDTVKYYRDEIHGLKCNSLNHPDINRKLVSLWCDMCDVADDDDKLAEAGKKATAFYQEILKAVDDMRYVTSGDMYIFSR